MLQKNSNSDAKCIVVLITKPNQTKRDRLIKVEIIKYEGVLRFKAIRSIS